MSCGGKEYGREGEGVLQSLRIFSESPSNMATKYSWNNQYSGDLVWSSNFGGLLLVLNAEGMTIHAKIMVACVLLVLKRRMEGVCWGEGGRARGVC